jgi:hypothetical protein
MDRGRVEALAGVSARPYGPTMLLILGPIRLPAHNHDTAPHLGEWRASWTGLGIGERNLRVYDVGEARPT